jgi:membrane protease YdiL (CAAX protease family)
VADYNLVDSRRLRHFAGGLAAGFAALSALVGGLAAGGWIHFGHAALTTSQALRFGAVWAGAFLLVGLFEEGSFRCYLLFTLTRGINFWWALATVSGLCLWLLESRNPRGSDGVFVIALLGVIPCWLVHRARTSDSSFWQASWATSTAFGYFHTSNNGENAMGIFAAALIGFVFCVSVRVTGSAWWAIGCHAAWDWAETYFYGTPDSGFVAQRHFLTTTPLGNALWSGGTDGPEGSLLVAPVILLLLAFLLAVYGRKRQATIPALP